MLVALGSVYTIEMTVFFFDQIVGNPVLIPRLGDVFSTLWGHPVFNFTIMGF